MDYLAQIDHFPKSACSNELAQESRSDSTELSITARPLCSMRNEPSRVTWPSLRAATLYCLAVSRTAASFDGVTETMARAPRSVATMLAIVLEYSEEENSRAKSEVASGEWRVASFRSPSPASPASSKITSPGLRKAILRTREASSRMPRTPMTGVG